MSQQPKAGQPFVTRLGQVFVAKVPLETQDFGGAVGTSVRAFRVVIDWAEEPWELEWAALDATMSPNSEWVSVTAITKLGREEWSDYAGACLDAVELAEQHRNQGVARKENRDE